MAVAIYGTKKTQIILTFILMRSANGIITFCLFLQSDTKPTPDPKACNWKKYKYIVLNPLCAVTTVKEEETEEQQSLSPTSDRMGAMPKTPAEAWSGEVPGQIDRYVCQQSGINI